MRLHPSRKFILGLSFLFVISLIGLLAWKKNKSPAVSSDRANVGASSLERLLQTHEDRLRVSKNLRDGSGKRPDVQKEARAIKEQMLTEFPALKVEKHPVPDEQNALLKLSELGAFINNMKPPLSEEFRNFLSGKTPWDAETAKRYLAQHAGLLSMIEKIAALETRSSEDLPTNYDMGFSARAGKISGEILLLKGRLAAETGDEKATLGAISAASNIGDHFRKVESPTILSGTVQITVDMAMKAAALETLLPKLGRNADLSLWKSALAAGSYTPSDLAQLMRGDWNAISEHKEFADVIFGERDGKITNAQDAARAYSDLMNKWVTGLPTLSLAQIESFNPQVETSHLSSKGTHLIDDIAKMRGWFRAYCNTSVKNSQQQAIIELLMLEQSGTTLSAADAERVTHDPMTGQPFIFDPTKRQLLVPPSSASQNGDAMALPW